MTFMCLGVNRREVERRDRPNGEGDAWNWG
jgi:hypothetical protein